jgi:hypothetical protein
VAALRIDWQGLTGSGSESRFDLAAALAQLGRLKEAREEAKLYLAARPHFRISHWLKTDNHEWVGGALMAKNGIICNPNIPSEEVSTAPHKGSC